MQNVPFRVYGRLKLNVWVCLVPPGRAPSGLTELSFEVVVQHGLFGRIVTDYNEYWRDRLR